MRSRFPGGAHPDPRKGATAGLGVETLPPPPVADGLGMGVGFTLAITLLGAARELLGNRTVTPLNRELVRLGEGFPPALTPAAASGARDATAFDGETTRA